MPVTYEIENIDAMRRREGIEDVELRAEIRSLAVGDVVKLTFVAANPPTAETVQVRITSIRGQSFEGVLAKRPASAALTRLRISAPVSFTAAHIHSIPNKVCTGRQRIKHGVR